MATITTSFSSISEIETAYDSPHWGLASALTWGQAAFDRANTGVASSYITRTASLVSLNLTTGDRLTAYGNNLLAYPLTTTKLVYEFVSSGIIVTLLGNVSRQYSGAPLAGTINDMEVYSSSLGRIKVHGTGNDISVAGDGEINSIQWILPSGITISEQASLAASVTIRTVPYTYDPKTQTYAGGSEYYASYTGTFFSTTLTSGSKSFSITDFNYAVNYPPSTLLTSIQTAETLLAGPDNANGGESSDFVFAFAGNDTLNGNGGDDTLDGGLGNDTLNGGAGTDTATFSGTRSQYTISSTASTWTISGIDGVDTLTNIEFARFSDQTIALDNTPTYGLTASSGSVNEGGSVTYTVTTTNVAANTVLNYTLSGAGITTADLGGAALTGTTTVGSNGSATFTVNLAADQLTEGAETLIATVQGQSASVTVNDTSISRAVAGRTKYFVLPSSTGANFIDFDLSYGSVSLTGEQVTFVGSSAVDAVFVRPGVTLDFTLSGSGADKIYLGGSFASYTASISGSVMKLERGSGSTLESVNFTKSTSAASSDSVIFANGTLNSLDLYNNLKSATALPALSTTETSLALATGSVLSASIKAFALNAGGDTFAPTKPGVSMTVVGSVGVDTVYVSRGGVVDCTLLGSGQDLIYFTGNWGDYTKVISGSVVTFSRTVDGNGESVRVVGSGTTSLNDQLVFADGAVHSADAKAALVTSLTATIGAVTGYDATMVTPGVGLGITLNQSALDNVTNLEVGSNIVLNFSTSVTAVAGKYIHIVNDGGTGFHGEATVKTLDILVTDTSQVTISSGGKVTLNPTADLDLANNYHITIDAGAFTSASGSTLAAYDGTTALNFSTVTPGVSSLTNAVASQVMGADGTLASGHFWLDIEGIGSPSQTAGTALDLSAKNYALVAKDYDAAGASSSLGYDGIKTADFYVAANNFGAGDLLYIDNQGVAANDLTQSIIINNGNPPTTLQFAGTTLGGLVNISLAGSSATFDTIAQMKTLLGTATSPVISA